jgi:hypothetical protein
MMCGSWSDCLLVLHPQITGDVVEHLHEAEDDIKADLRHYHEHIQQDITHGTALLSSQLGPSTALLDHAITSTGAQVPCPMWKIIIIYIYLRIKLFNKIMYMPTYKCSVGSLTRQDEIARCRHM